MRNSIMVVLSGGQDSTTCLYWAKQRFKIVHAVTMDYGQRHRIEIDAAIKIAEIAKVDSHSIVDLKGVLRSTSPLTSAAPLEEYTDAHQMEEVIGNRVELTFVPMRNTLFLTVAVNRALELGCRDVVTGICQEDNANYPDCTEDFRHQFEQLTNESLGLGNVQERIYIHAPLMSLSKSNSVKLANTLPGCMDALAYSHTSYDGIYPPTGMNHANVLRAKGFEDAQLPDPLVIRAWSEGLMEWPATHNYDLFRSK